MTKAETYHRLKRLKELGILMRTMLEEPDESQKAGWFQFGKLSGRTLLAFLLEGDPNDDPGLQLQAVQMLEALREDQTWMRRIAEGQGVPFHARWQ
jgi:hypothetical protein